MIIMANTTHVVLGSDDYNTYAEYKAGVYIWKIIPPILIIFGTFGNILSIVVLTRKSIRRSTTALYLTVLAFSDLVVLYSGLLRQWLLYLFEEDVRHVSPAGCKINIWLVYSSLDFSAWLLIAVTLERVISAWFPHSYRSTCTTKSAIALMVSIGVFLLGLNSHLLYGMVFKEKHEDSGSITMQKCVERDQNYSDFFNHTWPWVDLCAFCVIPFMVIVIGNTLILFKVLQSQKKAKSRIVPSITTGNGHHRHANSNHHGKQSSMTAMLFTLNIVFLFSTSPVSIYNIGYTHWNENANGHQIALLDLWWAIVNMFMYTNNSLNFLLYCLSGTKFRQEVVRLLCLGKDTEHSSQVPKRSNYTRTNFDVPSATPNVEHTESVNMSPESIRSSANITKSNTPIATITQIGNQQTSVYSGNTLHPNAALCLNNSPNKSKISTADQELSLVSVSSSV